MSQDKQTPSRASKEEPVLEPDELMAHIGRLSIFKTSVLSLVFHVLVVGLTSIGFVSLCVKYRTLYPKAAMTELTEKAEEAKRASAREAARRKMESARPATAPGANGAVPARRDGASPIERTLNETSREKPKPSDMKLDPSQ